MITKKLDNVVKNKHSGLTELETALRNLQSEVRYYRAKGDDRFAQTLEAGITSWLAEQEAAK